MTSERGICTNFGGCNNADEKLPVDVPPGGELRCPTCGLSLSPVTRGGIGRRTRLGVAAAAGVIVVVGLGFGVLGLAGRNASSSIANDIVSAGIASGVAAGVEALADEARSTAVPLETPRATGAARRNDSRAQEAAPPPPPASARRPVATASPTVPPQVQPTANPAPQVAAPPLVQHPAVGASTAPPQAAAPVTPQPATAPAPVAANPAPTPPPPAVAERMRGEIGRGTALKILVPKQICEHGSFKLVRGERIALALDEDVVGTGTARLAKGGEIFVRVEGRQLAAGQDGQPRLRLVADQVVADGEQRAVTTRPEVVFLSRINTNSLKRTARGGAMGAVAGAAIGFLIERDARGALTGAGVGAVAGAGAAMATGREWCIESGERLSLELADVLAIGGG